MGFVLERQGKFIHSRMCRKKIFSTGFWRILWKEFFPQPIHPHSTAPVDTGSACRQCARQLSTNRHFPAPPAGVPPVAISHGNLLRIVTAPPVPGIGGESPQTISHGSFLQFVFSLTRPVSFCCAIPFFLIFQSTAWERSRAKTYRLKRG